MTVSSSSWILFLLKRLLFYCLNIEKELLFYDICLQPIQSFLRGLSVVVRLLFLQFLLDQVFVLRQGLTSLFIGPEIGLLGVDIPSKAFSRLFLLLSIFFFEGISIKVKFVLSNTLGLNFLFGMFLLLQPLSLLNHLVIVGVILPDLLLQGCLGIEYFGLVDLQLQIQELVYVLLSELLSHLLRYHSYLLNLLDSILAFLLLLLVLILLPLDLEDLLLLVQLHQIPLALLQLLLVLICLIRVHSLSQQSSNQILIFYDLLLSFTDLLENLFLERIIPQKCFIISNLATINNNDWNSRFVLLIDRDLRHLLNNFHAINHLSKYDVLAIEMRTGLWCDKELWGVRVSAAVGHGQEPSTWMGPWKVLIHKSPPIYREAPFPPRVGNITPLDHEPVNDTMEFRVEIVEFGIVYFSILSRAQTSKVLGSFWGQIIEQFKHYPACTWRTYLHIHVHFVVCLRTHYSKQIYNRFFILTLSLDYVAKIHFY